MSGVGGIGAGGGGAIDRVMALRAQILERNEALQRAGSAGGASPVTSGPATKPASYPVTLVDALQSVNAHQRHAGALPEGYERVEPIDRGQVMLAPQKASVRLEAAMTVENKRLSVNKKDRGAG